MDSVSFNTGGFPLETETIDFLQKQTQMVASLAALGGSDTYILSGVKKEGVNITNGFIVYKGEILPFTGGEQAAKVTIIETEEEVTYQSDDNADGVGDKKKAYKRRVAKFGENGVETFNFSILKPFIVGVAGQMFKTFFKDIRLPYIGDIADIPTGWQICEVLSGFFPVVYDPNNPDYNQIGKTGGQDQVTLTEAQMPRHSHNGTTNDAGTHKHTGSTSNNGNHTHTGDTENAGAHKHTGSTYAAGAHTHRTTNAGSQAGHGKPATGADAPEGLGYHTTQSAGSHTHTLNMANAGEHNHQFTTDEGGAHNHSIDTTENGNHSHNVTTDPKGNNESHENRPKYKVIALIKYVG